MSASDMPKQKASVETTKADAKGQYARGLKHSDNNGVASAKPRVITGTDDATMAKPVPGEQKHSKDWDINYDERDRDDSEFRG